MFFLLVKQKDKHCQINTFPGGITITRAVLEAIYSHRKYTYNVSHRGDSANK